jgi:fidgetin-like protein 1
MKSSDDTGELQGPQINLDETQIDELVSLTKGYSGADLKALSAEASMIPLRSIEDIENVDISNIRPLTLDDFKEALNNVKATVNQNDLKKFLEFNDQYGSFQMKEEDLKD